MYCAVPKHRLWERVLTNSKLLRKITSPVRMTFLCRDNMLEWIAIMSVVTFFGCVQVFFPWSEEILGQKKIGNCDVFVGNSTVLDWMTTYHFIKVFWYGVSTILYVLCASLARLICKWVNKLMFSWQLWWISHPFCMHHATPYYHMMVYWPFSCVYRGNKIHIYGAWTGPYFDLAYALQTGCYSSCQKRYGIFPILAKESAFVGPIWTKITWPTPPILSTLLEVLYPVLS